MILSCRIMFIGVSCSLIVVLFVVFVGRLLFVLRCALCVVGCAWLDVYGLLRCMLFVVF